MSPRVKDTLTRAAKTFVQVFVPLFAAGLTGVDSLNALTVLALSAASAALAAAWNTVSKPSLPAETDPEVQTDPDVT